MSKIRFSRFLYSGLLFMLAACQAMGQPASSAMSRPGDTINSMSLTIGAADAPPLWAFCSPVHENRHVTKTDCRIPAMLSKVAIGQVFNIASEIPTQLDWSEFTWSLSVDGQPIDLNRFGTYQFSMQTISAAPSPVRAGFKTITTWDVVVTNLKPGEHTLHGSAQSETDTYTWMVNLMIEAPYGSDFGPAQ